ncbi:hypothetical protein GCM10009414_10900 [Tatumella terrea]
MAGIRREAPTAGKPESRHAAAVQAVRRSAVKGNSPDNSAAVFVLTFTDRPRSVTVAAYRATDNHNSGQMNLQVKLYE